MLYMLTFLLYFLRIVLLRNIVQVDTKVTRNIELYSRRYHRGILAQSQVTFPSAET